MADQLVPPDQTLCDCLTKVLEMCPNTRGLIAKLKDSGLQMADQENTNTEQERLATRLKANFFPNQS